MTHDAFAEKLLDLAYGELSPREAGKVEAHAASCEACRAELARIRDTRSVMSRLPVEPAPERGERILFAAARQAAEERAAKRRVPPWLWRVSLVAASLVLVVAVSYRVAEVRPARMLSKPGDEALLGGSYATPPAGPSTAAPPEARAAASGAVAEAPEPTAASERAERHAAKAERRDAPAMAAPRAAQAEDKKADAPAREERPSRAFAQPPPASSDAAIPAAPPPPAAAARPAPTPAPSPAPARREAPEPQASAAAPPQPEASSERNLRLADAPRDRELGAKASKPSAAKRAAAPEALGYAGSKAAAGAAPRFESRTFERCEGESRRRVEVDSEGRVMRYVREGTFDGRRVRIVHVFAPDGSLAQASAVDLERGVAVDPRALGVELPERAEDAGIDAPRRCAH